MKSLLSAAHCRSRRPRFRSGPGQARSRSSPAPGFDDHVIEHHARIVDRGVGDEIDRARLGIDLDFGNMTSVRKRQRRFDLFPGVEAFAFLLCTPCRFEQRDLAVSADHLEAAVAIRMSASEASSSADANFLPFASITSALCTMALPAHMAEREPTEANPVNPSAVSP